MARFAADTARCTRCAISLPADLSLGKRAQVGLCMDCIKLPPPIDATWVAVDYAYPWSGLISRYKFNQQTGWAPFFANLMLAKSGIRQVFDQLQAADLVLPVPLAKERLQTRGFNQAWELAKALAAQSGSRAKTDSNLLLRVKNTRPQTELLRQERLANVQGAFQVEPLRTSEIKGNRIVLVDDVMTSGASLYTAAQVLRQAGAAHITGIVLARTPQ